MAYYDGIGEVDEVAEKKKYTPPKPDWSKLTVHTWPGIKQDYDKKFSSTRLNAHVLERATHDTYVDPFFVFPCLNDITNERLKIIAEREINNHLAKIAKFVDADKAWNEVFDKMSYMLNVMGISSKYSELGIAHRRLVISQERQARKVDLIFLELQKHLKTQSELLELVRSKKDFILRSVNEVEEFRSSAKSQSDPVEAKLDLEYADKLEKSIIDYNVELEFYNNLANDPNKAPRYVYISEKKYTEPTEYFQVIDTPEENQKIDELINYYEQAKVVKKIIDENKLAYAIDFMKCQADEKNV